MVTSPKGNDDAVWHILGAGAQGLLWASQFADAGLPWRLLSRRRLSSRFSRETQTGTQTESRTYTLPADDGGRIRRALITVKAPDVAAVLQHWQHRIADDACLILLCNGMGADEAVRHLLPNARLLLGSSTHGSWLRAADQLIWAGRGELRLGPTFDGGATCEALPEGLPVSGFGLHWDADMRRVLWEKLLVNACINPLTAVLDCPNGALLTAPDAQADWPLLVREAVAVMHAEGLSADADALLARVRAVASATAANVSSMLQDVRAGRTTENAFISGYLLRTAARHGLSLTTHDRWQQRLRKRSGTEP